MRIRRLLNFGKFVAPFGGLRILQAYYVLDGRIERYFSSESCCGKVADSAIMITSGTLVAIGRVGCDRRVGIIDVELV